jgi:cytochrome c oxidase assembly protein subunit 15
MVAYALWLIAVLHAADVARTLRGGPALTGALALVGAVTLQAAFGIATLVHRAPLALALLHQGTAIAVLAIAAVHAERLERRPARVGAASDGTPLRRGEPAT